MNRHRSRQVGIARIGTGGMFHVTRVANRTYRGANRIVAMTIIVKTPLRISFAGGGTDIPYFYERYGGAVISTTIDRYVTVAVREDGKTGKRDENPIVRECLRRLGIDSGVSIEIKSDVGNRGTGLGNSSALTVGLLNALYTFCDSKLQYKTCYLETVARQACAIEIDVLGKPIGKQGQYASTYGGFRRYRFAQDGDVEVSECLGVHFPFKGQIDRLERHLLLFDTHIQRSADTVLESQRERNDIASLLKIKRLEEAFYNCLLSPRNPDESGLIGGDIDDVGPILHESWMLKRQLSEQTTNRALDEIYRRALDAGAVGGKLLGAGGGGHFLFYVRPDDQTRVKVALEGLATHVPFRFESKGTRLV